MKKRLISHKKYDYILRHTPKCCEELSKAYLHTICNINDCIVFIWLKNGNSFWYYIKYTKNNKLEGYISAYY